MLERDNHFESVSLANDCTCHILHCVCVQADRASKKQLDPSLDDRAHHETFVNQCNVSPITGFVRHTKSVRPFISSSVLYA